MSIIAEALKKAEESAQKTRKDTGEYAGDKPGPQKKMSLFPLLVTVILLFLSVGIFIYATRGEHSEPAEKQLLPHPENAAEIAVIEEKPEPIAPPVAKNTDIKETLVLNGIMYTPERPLAVINNNIYSEGDSVGEFVILEIKETFVKCAKKDGEELTLTLKH